MNLLDSLSEGNKMGNDTSEKSSKTKTIYSSQKENEKILFNSQEFPKKLLIIDTETNGLDPNSNSCIEIGSILFDVSHRSVLAQLSFLIPVEINEAEYINNIPPILTQVDQSWREALKYFQILVSKSDAIVAHNASFDKQWFGKDPLPLINKPWICSMEDICWDSKPQLKRRPSVRDLALAFGVPVWSAHRALSDCIYISEVFQRCINLEELLIRGLEPRTLVKAEISYEERHLAKKAGFRWNNPVAGAWSCRLSKREIKNLEFNVAEI